MTFTELSDVQDVLDFLNTSTIKKIYHLDVFLFGCKYLE
jgi:hypothetical protein